MKQSTMTPNRRSEIENIANTVLRQCSITEKPYKHITEIMRNNAISFRQADCDENIDGMLITNRGQKYIVINKNISSGGRKNFTKAHELGHFFLGHVLKDAWITCSQNAINEIGVNKAPQEQEADCFATCLLMPQELLYKGFLYLTKVLDRSPNYPFYVDKQPCNYNEWKTICAYYHQMVGVSAEALRYRLINLGLLKWNL